MQTLYYNKNSIYNHLFLCHLYNSAFWYTAHSRQIFFEMIMNKLWTNKSVKITESFFFITSNVFFASILFLCLRELWLISNKYRIKHVYRPYDLQFLLFFWNVLAWERLCFFMFLSVGSHTYFIHDSKYSTSRCTSSLSTLLKDNFTGCGMLC